MRTNLQFSIHFCEVYETTKNKRLRVFYSKCDTILITYGLTASVEYHCVEKYVLKDVLVQPDDQNADCHM